ncbi:MAG TPA: RDD family protein [Burkholderiales bacterium]|nr:RDD family protein [Burkholderiales bacterium]
MPGTVPQAAPPAALRPRLAAMVYEVMLLIAILFLASYLFLAFARDAQSGWPRTVFQIYLLAVCGAYFVYCWTRTGQTLPMKTWRLKVTTRDGRLLSPRQAAWRYVLAVPGMMSGTAVLWALFDREKLFLHDRLAGTLIVRMERVPNVDSTPLRNHGFDPTANHGRHGEHGGKPDQKNVNGLQ